MRMGMAWLGVLIVTGCVSVRTTWVKPGGTQSEERRDRYECERDARQSGYYTGAVNMQEFFNRCMGARGWSLQAVDENGNPEPAKPLSPSGPDPEALAEERRTAAILRGEKASDGGTPVEKAKFGRCTEDDMRGMLKQGMSSSAINSACFE